MHGESWMNILKKVPRNLHDNLMLLTTIGTEFALQQIVSMEEDYLVIRGRLSGSSDAGRAFFIPYDQINYIGFQRAMREDQLAALLGDTPPMDFAEARQAPEPAPQRTEPERPPEQPAPEPGAADDASEGLAKPEQPKPALADKQALLEKLRARARGDSKQTPKR